MKAGDKVYIICNNKWRWEGGRTCTVSKSGKIFFEIEEVGVEYKFCVDPKNEEYGNRSLFAKGKRKGESINDYSWYPSEKYYKELLEKRNRLRFVEKNVRLLTDEEIYDIYKKIIERK